MKRADVNKFPMKDTVLTALEPEEKEYRINDGNNLHFVVNPKGNKRWELRYKKPNGKWSWLGLGRYPDVGGKWARQKADEVRKLISQGIDPVLQKAEERQAELEQETFTFQQLAEDFYKTKTWTHATKVRNIGALTNHVFPVMGKRDCRKITRLEWFDLFQDIQSKLNPRTGKPIVEMGQRVRALVKEVYEVAVLKGMVEYNPITTSISKHLKKHVSNSMKHVGMGELPALLRAINQYPAEDTKIALRLLTMLFCRPSELREATWHEFDLCNCVWSIPAERMKGRKTHKVPLPVQAVELLHELKQLNGYSPFLFPNRSDKKKPKSNTVFIMALRRIGYGEKQNPHGFRHIASTILNNKFSDKPQVVEACLAHTKNGVKGTYDKATHFEERKLMMQWYADHLDQLADETVIQFKRV